MMVKDLVKDNSPRLRHPQIPGFQQTAENLHRLLGGVGMGAMARGGGGLVSHIETQTQFVVDKTSGKQGVQSR